MFIELDCDDSRFDDFDSTAKTYFFHYINKNALSKKQIIKYSFILLSVFVGRCAECKNVHSVSYIKKTPFLIHIYLYLDGKKLLAYSMEQSPS